MSRVMKDSGVEWILKCPLSWDIIRFKDVYSSKKEIVGDKVEEFERLSLTLKGVLKRSKDDNEGLQPKDFETYQILRKDDMVFKMIDLQNISTSRVGLSPYDGLVSPAYLRFEPRNKANEFMYFYFMSLYYNTVFNHIAGDGVRSALNAKDIGNIKCPLPSYDEQEKIVLLLKEKISKIDELITNQEEQIEKLKEINERLDSESFNKIHYSTVTKKMNELAFYKKGPFGSSLKVSMFVPKGENTFKVYEQKNAIYKDENLGYYYIDETKFMQLKSNEVFSGDIIVSCAGTIGECFIMPENIEKGIINQALMIVRPNELVNTNFMVLLLEEVFRNYGEQFSNGSAMKNIPPFDILKNIRVKIPANIDDQVKFAEELITRNNKIKKLISIKQQKIEKLNEYKKSLIYEYVTGKKEV